MQLHLVEVLLIHEGVHPFENFRHGIGKLLHGAGIVSTHKQNIPPVPQRMGERRKFRAHDDVPVLPERGQHVMTGLHAVGGKPAVQPVSEKGCPAASARKVEACKAPVLFFLHALFLPKASAVLRSVRHKKPENAAYENVVHGARTFSLRPAERRYSSGFSP